MTTSVNGADVTVSDAIEQLIAPVPPVEGVVQLQPAGDASDTNVVPVGSVSDSVTEVAALGPALLTVIE